ncbi:hypothetical protein J3R83DRAFT_4746 [Lanmaoa asiatica]|nr:hypothetical protein J3R83DRAFT_4746 [Lanmaoa asiatica]
MPLEFVISSIYWSLLLFSPHLIMGSIDGSQPLPGGAAKLMRLPPTIDLALHASPLLTLFIDFFVFEPKFSKTHAHKAAPVTVVVFAVCSTLTGVLTFFTGTPDPSPIPVLDT